MKFTKIRIYVGLRDRCNRMSNLEMVPYKALFNRFVREILPTYFVGCTIFDAVGMWKGVREESRVIEILIDPDSDHELLNVKTVCSLLKVALNQEAVLFTQEPVIGRMI